MFYGAQIKPGVTVVPSADDGGEILHLSQVCLVDAKDDARTFVQVNDGEKTYCIAVLQKDKCEQVSVDLFISTVSGVKLSTKGGKNEVHIVGYFEPESQDDVDFDGEDSESDSSLMNQLSNNTKIEDLDETNEGEDESDNELNSKPVKGKQIKNAKEISKKEKVNEETSKKDKKKEDNEDDEELEDENEDEDEEEEEENDQNFDEDENDDDDEDDDDIDDEDIDDENDDEDDDEDDDDHVPQLTNGVKHDEKTKGNKKAKKAQGAASTNKQSNATAQQMKRKNDNKTQNDSKKQKVDTKKGLEGNAEIENFDKELKKYLTANGRTNLGVLGQKVKKPAAIEKLGLYIKEHSSFKLENGFVSLSK